MSTPPDMQPHALTMRANGIYMLLRKIHVEAVQSLSGMAPDLCTCITFIVKKILQHSLHCELIQDDPNLPVRTFILPRITSRIILSSSHVDSFPFAHRPAFAITINKSQGGTFEWIGLAPSRSPVS